MPGVQDKVVIVTGAGGGLAQRVAQYEDDGVLFPQLPTLPEIASRWPEITDMSRVKPGRNPV